MEKWNKYRKADLQIELIDSFAGGNQELKIFLTDKKKNQWVLYFDCVWDFRYAIENAFICRESELEAISSIYRVENSEYMKYFEQQVAGTYPIDDLKHFLIFDEIDTGLEILTNKEPVLTPSAHESASKGSPTVLDEMLGTKKPWWRR